MPETTARCPFKISIDKNKKQIFKGLISISVIEELIEEEESINSMCITCHVILYFTS
jgi:hypothetical protein